MKLVNYASLIALLAGGIAISSSASATSSDLILSPTVTSDSHNVLASNDFAQDELFSPISHHQQQQQRLSQASAAGTVYGAPSDGFDV